MTRTEAQKIWDADIKETAETYYNEFQETNLDSEWSSTGFTENSRRFNEAVEVLGKGWAEYHLSVQTILQEIDSEIGIDDSECDSSNFIDGVFVI